MKLEVKNLIYTVRGTQVMLDSDLAALFEVETKVFNQAVKRNIDRFPTVFRFQLSKEEFENLNLKNEISSNVDVVDNQYIGANESLRSQSVALEMDGLKSQIVTLKKRRGQHRKYLPYVFSEHGVAMLTGLLRSEVAIQMSIRIMTAFVEMRKLVSLNIDIINRLENVEYNHFKLKNETEDKFNQIFNALQGENASPKQNVFFNGQIYDAYSFVIKLIEKAQKELLIIDNYVDNSVLDMISKKKSGVVVTIITQQKTPLSTTDIHKFNQQYPTLFLKYSKLMHDRFLLIDNKELYHIGASLKDLGKKCFAFSLIEDPQIISNLINNV